MVLSCRATIGPTAPAIVMDVENQPVPSERRTGGTIRCTAVASTVPAAPKHMPLSSRTAVSAARESAQRYAAVVRT